MRGTHVNARLRAAVAAATATVAVGGLVAPAANAGTLSLAPANCGPAPTSQPFRAFGDILSYTPVPGGSFEAGAPSWTLTGAAAVKPGNETFYVNAKTDSRSLSLPAGSSATSPSVCTGIDRPTIRFFARNTGSLLASLRVEALYPGLAGSVGVLQLGLVTGSSWNPSQPLPVLASLVSTLPGGSTSLAFRFTPVGSAGSWSIDDVYVDPIARR